MPLSSIASFFGFQSAYDAAKSSKNRADVDDVTGSEDHNLNPEARKKLNNNTHDLYRNFTALQWTVNRHLDFVCDHSFRARTGDDALNKVLQDFVKQASQKESFDYSQRHDRTRAMRLYETGRVLQGDIFGLKTQEGFLQAIEGDRIRDYHKLKGDWIQGLRINRGRVDRYAIHKRQGRQFEFERSIRADAVIPFGYYSRWDQYRGISPIASAANAFRDVYTGFDHALAKLKVEQFFAVAITRDSEWSVANEDADGNYPNLPKKKAVKLGEGPGFFDLRPSEKAEFLSSPNPSNNAQAFWDTVLGIALKSLDIPFSFFKEDYTNFSGNKIALTIYLNAVRQKRADVVAFLNNWLCWRLEFARAFGEVNLPEGFVCEPSMWQWIPSGLPWWDPREIQSDIALVESGLSSRTRLIQDRLGIDWEADVLPDLVREKTLLEDAGLTGQAAQPVIMERDE